ncbi:hypothetical protein ASwh1_375 [Aeromonas phage Aswh_1]|nr:hypothetical protein ASwh1_375 [Aeromonas phage Aswh_1]
MKNISPVFYTSDLDINIWRILAAMYPDNVTRDGDTRIIKINKHCTVTCVDTYATIFAANEEVVDMVIDMALTTDKYVGRVVAAVESQY